MVVLQAELNAIHTEQRQLEADVREAETGARTSRDGIAAASLAQLDQYRGYAGRQNTLLAQRASGCLRRIAEQQKHLTEARRNVELLEKLKERSFAAWRKQADRDEQALAEESYLSRWARVSRNQGPR